jgi:hypothetical protein
MTRKTTRTFNELFYRAEQQDDYWVARASLAFTESVGQLLEAQHMSRAELARRLGTSTAYVTKILRGDVNFTLRTMVRVSRVLGAEFHPVVEAAGKSPRARTVRAVARPA